VNLHGAIEMSLRLFDLTGKTAFVTGSARGLGFAMGRGLARCGAKVVLNDINEERLAAAVKDVRSEGLKCEGALFDVTDEAAVNKGIAEVIAAHGTIDILLNNAGINIRYPLEDFPYSEWKKVLDVNLNAAFLVTRAAVKGMIAKKAGKIINTCSLTSSVTRPTIAAYTAAKGGIFMLTRSMCIEWARHNIQANGIGPGFVATEMNTVLVQNPEFDGWVKTRTPAARWATPDDMAGAAIFLASDASNYVNGHLLYVDGGFTAAM
jgi:gluconate 5-dehydrogenase